MNLPPKKNLSSLQEITRRMKIVIGSAPRLRRAFGGQASPLRIFARGGLPRRLRQRNALCPVVSSALLLGFGLIQEYRVNSS